MYIKLQLLNVYTLIVFAYDFKILNSNNRRNYAIW